MLRCDFQYQRADFKLNIQLEMQDQLLGIVGASGSGKSTFLKILSVYYIQFKAQFSLINRSRLVATS